MNIKLELEKMLPPKNGIKYEDEHGLIAKIGWNSALSDSLTALEKRVAGVEEIWNEIEQYYIEDDDKASELAQALQSKYIWLRKVEK